MTHHPLSHSTNGEVTDDWLHWKYGGGYPPDLSGIGIWMETLYWSCCIPSAVLLVAIIAVAVITIMKIFGAI